MRGGRTLTWRGILTRGREVGLVRSMSVIYMLWVVSDPILVRGTNKCSICSKYLRSLLIFTGFGLSYSPEGLPVSASRMRVSSTIHPPTQPHELKQISRCSSRASLSIFLPLPWRQPQNTSTASRVCSSRQLRLAAAPTLWSGCTLRLKTSGPEHFHQLAGYNRQNMPRQKKRGGRHSNPRLARGRAWANNHFVTPEPSPLPVTPKKTVCSPST